MLSLLATLPVRVLANDILSTEGFTSCVDNPTIKVTALNITYNRNTRVVDFNAAGVSTQVQNVTAFLTVSAYGIPVYNNSFNPCDQSTFVKQLCPGMPLLLT